jgi:translation initiation factor IF-2
MSGQKTSTGSNLTRPPIITLMGHIDHGKTTLLDKIRNTRTWYKETKGITQHTSAYQAQVPQKNGPPQVITFIDTPGHAAFCDMRSRGAKVTDLVVLVVDAKEGIKPQTKECLKLIQKDDTPFLVAINKMDVEGVTPDKVNSELVSEGFSPEVYGGQLATIPLSAKTGQGIDQLLEMILLNADLLDLKADPDADPQGVVIESFLDSSSGPLATIILKNGSLKVGQEIYIASHKARIKALRDETGRNIKLALPSQPVQVLGFSSLPPVGEKISLHPPSISDAPGKTSSLPLPKEEEKRIPVLIKADTQGTLEALTQSLSNNVEILSASIGDLTENDLLLAQTAQAQIFIFRAKVPPAVKKLAHHESIKLFCSDTIYEILEELEKQVLKMLEPTIDEEITGQALIIAEFIINKDRIAGCRVEKGVLKKGDKVHLKRGENLIKNTTIDSLRQGKEDITQVKAGNECGLLFKPYIDFKKKDVIMSYIKKVED